MIFDNSFLVVVMVKFNVIVPGRLRQFRTCFPIRSSFKTASFLVGLGVRDGYLRKIDWDRVVW
jgi:hypothetical protein